MSLFDIIGKDCENIIMDYKEEIEWVYIKSIMQNINKYNLWLYKGHKRKYNTLINDDITIKHYKIRLFKLYQLTKNYYDNREFKLRIKSIQNEEEIRKAEIYNEMEFYHFNIDFDII